MTAKLNHTFSDHSITVSMETCKVAVINQGTFFF